MEEMISLGSNCSITYQLNKYNKRQISYPFDWSKITINQLLSVLENNLNDYENVFIKKFSKNHEDSYILSNKYNITFAHEIVNKYNLEEFKQIIMKRKKNFSNITNSTKCFIRIELKQIKEIYIEKLRKLCLLLNKYCENYKLILLVDINCKINLEINSNIIVKKVVIFENYKDWKMDYINWLEIL